MVLVAFGAQNRRFEAFKRFIGTIDRGFSTVCRMSPPGTNSRERYCYNPTLYWHPQVEEYFAKAYGADHFARISKVLTYPSCYSCIRVNTLKTTREAIIQRLTEMLQNESYAGTANDINICNVDGNVGGSTKDQGNLHNPDYHDKILEGTDLLNGCLKGEPVAKCPISGLDEVVFVQGTGPHNIDYDCATGKPLKEVIVSRKCAESVLRGAQVYVPGVLACSCHVEEGDKVAVSVAVEQPEPDGKWGAGITRGIVLQGSQTDPQYFQREGMYIGEGTALMSRAGIFRALQGIAISMTKRVFDLPSFNNVLKGEIFLQNLPSIVTAHVLDPQKGERILDMCAAPGGKTTAIAMLMNNEGQVVAVDRSHNKVHDIQKLASEMGLKSITTYKLDALKSVSRINQPDDNMGGLHHVGNDSTSDLSLSRVDYGGSNEEEKLNGDLLCEEKQSCCNENAKMSTCMSKSNRKKSPLVKNGPGKNHTSGARVEKSKGFTPNSFDRVLLDAPCSALGLRPRLFAGEETIESLQNHGKYQRKMFDQAVQLVRPGGVIVYSTCTINPGENEALVRYALDTYKFLSLAPQHPRVGGAGLVGSYTFSDGRVEHWLRPGEENLVQRFDPSVVDTIGFFIAKFNVDLKDA